jgi:hypothetical protein
MELSMLETISNLTQHRSQSNVKLVIGMQGREETLVADLLV